MWVALVVATCVGLLFWRLISILFPRKIVDLSSLPRWAVVTGATDGIGHAFTQELAAKGFNIVLVSRSEDKLKKIADEIEERFGVSTKICIADFSSMEGSAYERLRNELKYIEVGVLVNNVGTEGGHPELFLELEKYHSDAYRQIVDVNIMSAVNMTRFLLPGMVSRGKGFIINVSSGFAQLPAPMLVMYGATKSFLKKFSEDLNLEVSCKGVHVHVLTTGLVATKLSGVKASFAVPSAATYVQSALEQSTRRVTCEGYFGHTVFSIGARLVECLIPGCIGWMLLQRFSSSRDKFLRNCSKCTPRD